MFAGIGIIGALASILASLLVSPATATGTEPAPDAASGAAPVADAAWVGAIVEELAGLRAEVAGQRAEIAALRASLDGDGD